jgi:oxalate decarboxylase
LLALGATIIGSRNVELERRNPNLLRSLYAYAGIIPNMKLSFADAHNRLLTVGWAREVTQRERARGHHL